MAVATEAQFPMSKAVADALGDAERDRALAEARKMEAEARKLAAETEKAASEALVAGALAETARINADKAAEIEAERKADNWFQRIYVFDSPVGDNSVSKVIERLDVWRRLDPGCTVTIRFCSPGGDVISGMYLYDYLLGLRSAGHRVTTEAYGYAASMAGILLQAGDVRRIGRKSYILIHEISFGAYGKIGVVEDEVAFVKKIGDRVLDIFAAGAKKAKEAGTASKALSRDQFKKRWTRKDWWLSSDEALKFGVVDEVV